MSTLTAMPRPGLGPRIGPDDNGDPYLFPAESSSPSNNVRPVPDTPTRSKSQRRSARLAKGRNFRSQRPSESANPDYDDRDSGNQDAATDTENVEQGVDSVMIGAAVEEPYQELQPSRATSQTPSRVTATPKQPTKNFPIEIPITPGFEYVYGHISPIPSKRHESSPSLVHDTPPSAGPSLSSSPIPIPPPAMAASPRVQDRLQYALDKARDAFPRGYDIIPTSSEGMFCTFFALIESIKAQHPQAPIPDMWKDLVPMLDSSELEDARNALEACRRFCQEGGQAMSREAAETNHGHLLIDHAIGAVYHWFRKTHQVDVAIGLIREAGDKNNPRPPQLFETDTTGPNTLYIWIYCDMAYDNVAEGFATAPPGVTIFNHFSGLRSIALPPTPCAAQTPRAVQTPHAPQTPRFPRTPRPGAVFTLPITPKRKLRESSESPSRRSAKRQTTSQAPQPSPIPEDQFQPLSDLNLDKEKAFLRQWRLAVEIEVAKVDLNAYQFDEELNKSLRELYLASYHGDGLKFVDALEKIQEILNQPELGFRGHENM